MKMILERGDEAEFPLALAIVTQLAFDEENAKWIDKEMQKLLDSKFVRNENQKLRRAAFELKWVVEQKTGRFGRTCIKYNSLVEQLTGRAEFS